MFAVVVEEEGDVGVFFGFGAAELFDTGVTDYLAEDVEHFGWAVEDDVRAEAFFVVGEGGEVDIFFRTAVEFGEMIIDKGAGEFSGAIATEVEEDDAIVIVDGANELIIVIDDEGGGDKFVAFSGVVQGVVVIIFYSLGGGMGFLIGVFSDHTVIGFFYTVPAIIAVHSPKAAGDGGDFAYIEFFTFFF